MTMMELATVTSLLIVAFSVSSCRKSDASDTERSLPTALTRTIDPSEPRYESKEDAFRVSFPLRATPQAIVDPPETVENGHLAGSRVTRVSYYVAKGDLTFLVEVRRYSQRPSASGDDWRRWALEEMRGNAKQLLEERAVSIKGPRGEQVVGVQVIGEMPAGVRVRNAMFVYGNRLYAIGAAPVTLKDAATYDRFLRSFELLDQSKAVP
jgi:hypothetical protein